MNRDTAAPLKQFAAVLEDFRREGRPVVLRVHSPYPIEEIRSVLGPLADAVYAGSVAYEDLPSAFRAADGLLLPLDFTPGTIKYIRLSLLTKATEYMISGTPIFLFAPEGLATTEYLLAHDAAFHCGNPDGLKAAIATFMDDPDTRARIGSNALRRAREAHLIQDVNERMRQALNGKPMR